MGRVMAAAYEAWPCLFLIFLPNASRGAKVMKGNEEDKMVAIHYTKELHSRLI